MKTNEKYLVVVIEATGALVVGEGYSLKLHGIYATYNDARTHVTNLKLAYPDAHYAILNGWYY
jgi:hypothetical protein